MGQERHGKGSNGSREKGLAGEGSKVLQRSRLGRRGSDDDGVAHGIVLLERLDQLGDGGTASGRWRRRRSKAFFFSSVPLFHRVWFNMASRATAVLPV